MKIQKDQKKKNNQQWIVIALYMMTGALCGILIMNHLEHASEAGVSLTNIILSAVLLFGAMYAATLIQIVIHEAGHLVFGLLTGYRFSSFRVFNCMLVKEENRLRFRRMSIAGTGGQCLMGPPDMKDGKIPFQLYNYGGVIMNIISAVISVMLYRALPFYSFRRVFCGFLAVIGFTYALINGIPFMIGTVNNDGRNVRDLLHSDEALRAFWIQMKVSEMITRGFRIKDMPDEWFVIPSDESMKNGMIAPLGVFACSRLMDQHRFQEAGELIRRLLSQETGIVGLHRSLMTCDGIYAELVTENRPDQIREMYEPDDQKILKTMKTYPSVLRTDYTYALLAEQDPGQAAEIEKQFEKCIESYPYSSEITAEKELVDIANHIYSNQTEKKDTE